MKWYSVKEHQSVLGTCCALLAVQWAISKDIHLMLGEWDGGWRDWEHKNLIEEDEDLKVLYFCYPDPIPKVYDSLIDSKDKEVGK